MRIRGTALLSVLLVLAGMVALTLALATGGHTASAASIVPAFDEVSVAERDAVELSLGDVVGGGEPCTPDASLVGLGGQTCDLAGGTPDEPQSACDIHCQCVVSHNTLECWCWIIC